MSVERNRGWIVTMDNGSYYLADTAGVYSWVEHPDYATCYPNMHDALVAAKGVPNNDITVVSYTPQAVITDLVPVGFFTQPYAENPSSISQVDESARDDDDVFPLYRALDNDAADSLVARLETLKLGGAYNGIQGTDCFNNGITAAQVELRKIAMLNRTKG